MYDIGDSGLKIAPLNVRDYIRENVFGAQLVSESEIKPLGRIEKIMNSPIKDLFLYQGRILSCVSCASSMANQINSWFMSEHPVRLSWRDLYIQIAQGRNEGTSIDDTLYALKNVGQCNDLLCPNFIDGRMAPDTLKRVVTNEIKTDRNNYRIKNFFSVRNVTRAGLYTALIDTQLIVGAGGNNPQWSVSGVIRSGQIDWYHAFVIVDVLGAENVDFLTGILGYRPQPKDYGAWVTIQAWKDNTLDVRLLDKNYPITVAKTIEDLPDNVDVNTIRWNMALVRDTQNGKIYFVDSDNIAHWIDSELAFKEFFGINAWTEEAWTDVDPAQVRTLQHGEVITLRQKQLTNGLLELIKKFGQAFGFSK